MEQYVIIIIIIIIIIIETLRTNSFVCNAHVWDIVEQNIVPKWRKKLRETRVGATDFRIGSPKHQTHWAITFLTTFYMYLLIIHIYTKEKIGKAKIQIRSNQG